MIANISAKNKLESMGFKVTFGKHVNECDILKTSSISSRINDLHAAFMDPNVKAILSVIGGLTSNELLPYIDYELIKLHPKIICGFSDFTALANAITAKTGLITYYGPAYATLKMMGFAGAYQDKYWQQALTSSNYPKILTASSNWQSGPWYQKKANLLQHKNEWKVYHPGTAKGDTVGGNLDTFNLLLGTPYQPNLFNKILLAEFSEAMPWEEFSRNLANLLQSSENPKALLIGRFPLECNMTEEKLVYVLNKFPILKKIPVMYDVNFGHAQPIFTIPIGDTITVNTDKKMIIYDN